MGDAILRRAHAAFMDGFRQGAYGQPGDLTVIQTADGPVEGVRDEDTIVFRFKDGRFLSVHLLEDGNLEAYMEGRLVGRVMDDPANLIGDDSDESASGE